MRRAEPLLAIMSAAAVRSPNALTHGGARHTRTVHGAARRREHRGAALL